MNLNDRHIILPHHRPGGGRGSRIAREDDYAQATWRSDQRGALKSYVVTPNVIIAAGDSFTSSITVPETGLCGPVELGALFEAVGMVSELPDMTLKHGGTNFQVLDYGGSGTNFAYLEVPRRTHKFLNLDRRGVWQFEVVNDNAATDAIKLVAWSISILGTTRGMRVHSGSGGGGGGGGTTLSFSFSTDGYLDVLDTRDSVWRSIALLETGSGGGGSNVTPTFSFVNAGALSVIDESDSNVKDIALVETGGSGGSLETPQFQFNTVGFLDVFDARDSTWKQIALNE